MKIGGSLPGLMLPIALAACSGSEPAPGTDDGVIGTSAGPTEKASATPSAGSEEPGAAASGSGMSAGFGPLTGAVSDLNIRLTDMGAVIDLPSDALFEYDKATLTPEAELQLRKAADLIRQSPPGPVRIIGHTDSHGGDAYNMTLSEERARAVAAWFGQQVGVRNREMAVSGAGETKPIAPNERAGGGDDPAGRAKNRRVEVVVPRATKAR